MTLLPWIVWQREIWQTRLARRRLNRKYKADLAAARKSGKSQDELFAIAEASFGEERYIDEELIRAETSYLYAVAHHLRVPAPDHFNKSLWRDESPMRILTDSALSDFRAAIRKERNERWQYWELRLKVLGVLLTGLTGAIGTLIGLIAILRK